MKQMKKIFSVLGLCIKECPSFLVLLVFQSLITSLHTVLNVVLPKYLIDELLGSRELNAVVLYTGLIVANNVLMALIENYFTRTLNIKRNYLRNSMDRALAKKIMSLEYSYLEDPYYLDLKERAVFALENQDVIRNVVSIVSNVVTGLITIITLTSILFTLGPVLIIVLACGIVLDILIYRNMSKEMAFLQDNMIPINRQLGYYFNLSTERKNQKDIRIFDMAGLISRKLHAFNKEMNEGYKKVFIKTGKSQGKMTVVNEAVAVMSYIYLSIRALTNVFGSRIGIGSLTMYVSSATSFTSTFVQLGTDFADLTRLLGFLDSYMEFMGLEEAEKTSGVPFEGDIESIEFKDVTFTYPKAPKSVLKNISFEIHKGQKISIVGLNGAGKSTLVKLICRMYKADSGTILINGKDIYSYDYDSYMKAISAVFQDFKIFNFSIASNITSREDFDDFDRVMELIKEVGLERKISELPDGIKSQFGKEYNEDGIEMSGGESQKIAIARALYKKASLVILDEPASALDPIAEAEIYEKFNSLVEDKTAIYISHRMSSSVFCDKILIIEGGTVVDFDTHKNLMQKKDSLYYRLFMSQAENYRIEKKEA